MGLMLISPSTPSPYRSTVNDVVQVRAKVGDVPFDAEQSRHASDNLGIQQLRRECRAGCDSLERTMQRELVADWKEQTRNLIFDGLGESAYIAGDEGNADGFRKRRGYPR